MNRAATGLVVNDRTERSLGGFDGETSIRRVTMCPRSSMTRPRVTLRRNREGSGSPSSVKMDSSSPICFEMSNVWLTQTQPAGSCCRRISRGSDLAPTGAVGCPPDRFSAGLDELFAPPFEDLACPQEMALLPSNIITKQMMITRGRRLLTRQVRSTGDG